MKDGKGESSWDKLSRDIGQTEKDRILSGYRCQICYINAGYGTVNRYILEGSAVPAYLCDRCLNELTDIQEKRWEKNSTQRDPDSSAS